MFEKALPPVHFHFHIWGTVIKTISQNLYSNHKHDVTNSGIPCKQQPLKVSNNNHIQKGLKDELQCNLKKTNIEVKHEEPPATVWQCVFYNQTYGTGTCSKPIESLFDSNYQPTSCRRPYHHLRQAVTRLPLTCTASMAQTTSTARHPSWVGDAQVGHKAESCCWLQQTAILVISQPDTWPYRVNAKTGCSSVSVLSVGETAGLVFNIYLVAAACKIVWADLAPKHTLSAAWVFININNKTTHSHACF